MINMVYYFDAFFFDGKFGELLRYCIAAYKRIAPMQPPRTSSEFLRRKFNDGLCRKEKIMSTLKEKKLFLLDMDGTIYLDNDLFDGTLDFLEHVNKIGGR